ncbi:hypothetical protein F4777DRAFT_101839 [Nemania sp. FL0916]|nr:hypothetical protein F4777DRAFT_101839 [Nemania sp. FL0916]
MSEAYLRTGRGGAGNFYTQKDVEEAVTKSHSEDPEAQKVPSSAAQLPVDSTSTAPSVSAQQASAGGYARSGRGGAGNFVPASSSSSSTATTSIPPSWASSTNIPPSTSTTISAPHPASGSSPTAFPPTSTARNVGTGTGSSKYSGRGGAGNWAGEESEGTRRAKEEQERRRREALDAGIAREIQASMPQQPARTYHLHQPGRGRRPEDDVDVVDI